MSTQSLIIKDGNGDVKSLVVESSSYGYTPYHRIESSDTNAVHMTASLTNPVPVTGTISVDVTIGDVINVTASAANPAYVTGTVTVNTASTIAVSNFPSVQYVTSSQVSSVWVTGSITVNTGSTNITISNLPATQAITASTSNPVAVTGTVAINNSVLTVTSSQTTPIYAINPPVGTVTNTAKTSFTWITSESGTFAIATKLSTRRGLTVFNPGPNNLYIALSTAGGAKNGFTLTDINSAPSVYSFIVYPSGTYIADPTTVGVYHGGYFINNSSSNVFISEISY